MTGCEGRRGGGEAYPNPSSGPVYLTYSVVEGVENATLEVYTEQGQLVMSKTLGNSNGIAELNTQQWAPGVHVAVLYFDGLRVGSTKLNMVR
ncbi:MAG: T9SS type A sorting domain-containing protein [Flavobacteriales bacterium]